MSGPVFVALDFETTGLDIEAGAYPIELGIAVGGTDIAWMIKADEHEGDGVWSEKAAAVHGLTLQDIESYGEPTFVVEARAIAALADLGMFDVDQKDRIIVGWNVASFDLLFLKRWFPTLASLFSYRTVDLNAVCYAFEGAEHPEVGLWSFARVKDEAMVWAQQRYRAAFGEEARLHRAGVDAIVSLFAFEFLQAEVAR